MDFYQFLAQLLPPPPNYKPCTSPVITHSNENVFYQKLQPPEHQFSSCNRPDKKQGRKSSYSEEQKAILEDCFISSRGYINRETRNKLAAQMNISPQRVSYWFNSHRAKLKKENGFKCKEMDKNANTTPSKAKTTPSLPVKREDAVIHILPEPNEYLSGIYPCPTCPKVFKKYPFLENHFYLYHSCENCKCSL